VSIAKLNIESYDGPTQSSYGSADDLLPPQDVHAEQSVIGAMLLSKDAIADCVEGLKTVDFYRPAHELIYDTILNLYSRGEPADAITVSDELTKRGDLTRVGGQAYLHQLISSVPTAANAGYYAEIVAERAVLRRLVDAGTKIVQMGYGQGGGAVVDIVNAAQAEIYAVADKRGGDDYAVLGDVLEATVDEIEHASGRSGEMTGVPTGFTDFDNLTNGLHPGQMIVVAARPAVGKALALDTALPTPSGWTTMGEVAAGDLVLGADGRATMVTRATDVMTGRACFEVEFSDGSVIVADAEHQWLTDTRSSGKSFQAARDSSNLTRNQGTVLTTREIAATSGGDAAEKRFNHSVPIAAPLDLCEQSYLISPYVLGAWLGDGRTASAQITTADAEMVMRLEAAGLLVTPLASPGRYSLRWAVEETVSRQCVVCGAELAAQTSEVKARGQSCDGRAKTGSATSTQPRCADFGAPCSGLGRLDAGHLKPGSVQTALATVGVLNDKHIPTDYLRGGQRQRRELLAGLLDTVGTVSSDGCAQLTATSERLSRDFYELVVSLGYRCAVSRKRVPGRSEQSSTAFTLTFSSDDDVFGLERKRLLHKELRGRTFQRGKSHFISAVRPIQSVPVRCIEVANEAHLYLAGESMIPTHNSTWGLDIARSAAIKHKMTTVLFSLEMSRTEITMRLLSAEASIQLQNMRKGTMRDEDWTRLARTMGEVSDAPLFIDDSPNMSLMEIRAKCRRLKQRHNLRLVIIDYLQLMSSGKRVESRQQEVSEFSRALKLLAKELEVPVIAISQLNRGSEQRTDKRPQMSDLRESGCLTADARILRADTGAESTLGELYAEGATDVPVWALDESLRYVQRHLTHVFPTGVKPVFRLTLASGKTVRATENHPFLAYEGWTQLSDLRAGSRVAVPRHVPAPQEFEPWQDDKVVLLAQMLGDGSFVRGRPTRYASIDEQNPGAVSKAVMVFGVAAVRDDSPAARSTTLRLRAPFALGQGKRDPVAEWLCELGVFGLRRHEKFVPEPIFHVSKRQIALFVKHIWASDGSVTVKRNGQSGRIHYTSTSRRLVDDLSRLLLRFGICTRTQVTRTSADRDGYTIDVSGVDDQRRFLQEIGVHGDRSVPAVRLLEVVGDKSANTEVDMVRLQVWDRVREVMVDEDMTQRELQTAMGTTYRGSTMRGHSPSPERLGRVAAVLDDADLELLAVNDVLWDSVVSIDPDGVEEVYDATVLGTHNFVANGIAVHNSIEQDADMVILLHRESMYERESPREGEADLIVAKHRNGPTDTITVAFQGHYSRFTNMATNF
jgi:replicative DNA helicase